jgi:Transcription factor subunit Med10 of Mediator complex
MPSVPGLPTSTGRKVVVSPGAKIFQDQLHELITRLTMTMDHVKNWNEATANDNTTTSSTNNTSSSMIHFESTTRLIALIQNIVKSIQKVETTLQNNVELRQVLQNVYVPYDLLDLLDYTNINPDMYLRGLVTEAMGQLVGLQRRKNALQLLSTSIESKLNEQDEQQRRRKLRQDRRSKKNCDQDTDTEADQAAAITKKREREGSVEPNSVDEEQQLGDEPTSKKPKL